MNPITTLSREKIIMISSLKISLRIPSVAITPKVMLNVAPSIRFGHTFSWLAPTIQSARFRTVVGQSRQLFHAAPIHGGRIHPYTNLPPTKLRYIAEKTAEKIVSYIPYGQIPEILEYQRKFEETGKKEYDVLQNTKNMNLLSRLFELSKDQSSLLTTALTLRLIHTLAANPQRLLQQEGCREQLSGDNCQGILQHAAKDAGVQLYDGHLPSTWHLTLKATDSMVSSVSCTLEIIGEKKTWTIL